MKAFCLVDYLFRFEEESLLFFQDMLKVAEELLR